MPQSVYLSDTSSEIADTRRLLIDQIRKAGLTLVELSEADRQDEASLHQRVREKIQAADAVIGVVTYRRGWEPASLNGQSLAELEYDTARDLNRPIAILMPQPESDLAEQLRQWAIGQPPAQRDAQRNFMQQVQRESPVVWFSDEADLTEEVARLLAGWSEPRSTQVVRKTGGLRDWWQHMFDLDGFAEQIADRVQQKLSTLQQRDQMDMVEQAMKYQEALRLKPGELVFGKPLTGTQFQSDVFVIMPFAAEFDSVYRGVIRPLLDELKLRSVRGDEFVSRRGSVIEEVWAALNACQLVIADISGGNDNVFYELGIAHTLNKPAIILTQAESPEGVPFDIRHLRYISYQNTETGRQRMRADLESALTWLLSDLQESWG